MKSIRFFSLLLALSVASPFLAGAQQQDPAEPIYKNGDAAYKKGDYATAANAFLQIIKSYGGSRFATSARFELGLCYFELNDFDNAIKYLQPFADPTMKNEEARTNAIFFIARSHLGLAKKSNNSSEYQKGIDGCSALIKDFPKSPLIETVKFIRLGAYLDSGDQDQAINELKEMLTTYASSPGVVDYQNLLAQLYAARAFKALQSGMGTLDDAKATAQQALDLWQALDKSDPALNYTVTEDIGNLKFLLASKNPTDLNGFKDNLALFRSMQSFDEAAAAATARNAVLRQAAIRSNGDPTITQKANVADGHLAQMKAAGDLGATVLLREAESLNALEEGDLVRTILHHISSSLPADDQEEFDKLMVFSYISSGTAAQVQAGINAYKTKHGSDSSIDGVELQAATRLRKAGQFEDAFTMCKASLTDFPNGRYATDVLTLGTDIATKDLHRPEDVNKLSAGASSATSDDPQYLITKAYSLQVQGKYKEALAIYIQVKNNPAAKSLAAQALMQMIAIHQKLSELNGNDLTELAQVASLSKEFIAKYPNDKSVENARLMGDMASDSSNSTGDPAALADLASLAASTKNEGIVTTAQLYLIKAYQKNGDLVAMDKAATSFRSAFPNKTALLAEITKIESDAYVGQKQYAKAIEAYQAELGSSDKDVSADAQTKIGDVYSTQGRDEHDAQKNDDAAKALAQAENAYMQTLNNYADQTKAVAAAIDGLMSIAQLHVAWGDYKDQTEVEKAFDDYTAKVTSPEGKFHLQLARIGCVFIERDGRPNVSSYPKALADLKKLLAANPNLELSRQETVEYVKLLASQKQTADALQLLDAEAGKVDQADFQGLADLYFAYATCYIQQNRWADAKAQFEKMHELPDDALTWYPDSMQVKYDLAFIAENSGDPTGALKQYAAIMGQSDVRYDIHAEAMLGCGRILEKQGLTVDSGDPANKTNYAAYYYRRIDTVYGTGVPELSAEGLMRAMQLYLDAKNTTEAQKMFDRLVPYKTLAPTQYADGAAKATIGGLTMPTP